MRFGCTTTAQKWSKPPRIRSTLVPDFVAHTQMFANSWPKFDRSRSQFGRNRPILVEIMPNLLERALKLIETSRASVEMAHNSPEVARKLADSARSSVETAPNNPEFCRSNANIGRTRSKVVRNDSGVSQGSARGDLDGVSRGCR